MSIFSMHNSVLQVIITLTTLFSTIIFRWLQSIILCFHDMGYIEIINELAPFIKIIEQEKEEPWDRGIMVFLNMMSPHNHEH